MIDVGITACSDGLPEARRGEVEQLCAVLENTGRRVHLSSCIYKKNGGFSGTGQEKARELMNLFCNPEITDIYDISGGDMANEVLDDLDFDRIRESKATFWGYSDLTTVLNAIYTRTGKSGVLYQIRNLVSPEAGALQQQRFADQTALFQPALRMVQGSSMEGIVVGGNIRCFLKLAGTPYFPDLTGKILLLESLGGRPQQMVTYLAQLRSCGTFEKIRGILLGTFTRMEAEGCQPDMCSLVRRFAGPHLPIAETPEIGHSPMSRAIRIGAEIRIGQQGGIFIKQLNI